MSSSQANASARRRRAAPPSTNSINLNNVGPGSVASVGNNIKRNMEQFSQPRPGVVPPQQGQQKSQQQTSINSGPRQPLTPPQMLISHERRLTEIEKIMPDLTHNLNEIIGSLGVPSDENEEAPWDLQVNQLSERIEKVENNLSTGVRKQEGESEDIDFYKNKLSELEKKYETLNKMIMSVQEFSIETNLTLMRYKNGNETNMPFKELSSELQEEESQLDFDSNNNVEGTQLVDEQRDSQDEYGYGEEEEELTEHSPYLKK